MLFESLTITVLATLWSAWNANKQATPETANSDQQSESADKKSEQNTNHLLDERLTERRNEYFIQLYAILISPEKSHFQQLTILCKQLACIYGISSNSDFWMARRDFYGVFSRVGGIARWWMPRYSRLRGLVGMIKKRLKGI